jgi:hypothetical protein
MLPAPNLARYAHICVQHITTAQPTTMPSRSCHQQHMCTHICAFTANPSMSTTPKAEHDALPTPKEHLRLHQQAHDRQVVAPAGRKYFHHRSICIHPCCCLGHMAMHGMLARCMCPIIAQPVKKPQPTQQKILGQQQILNLQLQGTAGCRCIHTTCEAIHGAPPNFPSLPIQPPFRAEQVQQCQQTPSANTQQQHNKCSTTCAWHPTRHGIR